MEEKHVILASARSLAGKGENRRLRAAGMIPAVCYGTKDAPLAISVDLAALRKALDPAKGRNTLLQLAFEGKKIPSLLKDVQYNAARGDIVHADFIRVRMDQAMKVLVPIEWVGKAEGVKEGGTLHQVYRDVPVMCLPDRIPDKIQIDISSLVIGQSIHTNQVVLPEGVRIDLDATTTLCVVTAPQVEKASTDVVAASGDAAAKPADGAAKADDKAKAPAAGAKGK